MTKRGKSDLRLCNDAKVTECGWPTGMWIKLGLVYAASPRLPGYSMRRRGPRVEEAGRLSSAEWILIFDAGTGGNSGPCLTQSVEPWIGYFCLGRKARFRAVLSLLEQRRQKKKAPESLSSVSIAERPGEPLFPLHRRTPKGSAFRIALALETPWRHFTAEPRLRLSLGISLRG